jgi:hypothetical protein
MLDHLPKAGATGLLEMYERDRSPVSRQIWMIRDVRVKQLVFVREFGGSYQRRSQLRYAPEPHVHLNDMVIFRFPSQNQAEGVTHIFPRRWQVQTMPGIA